MGTLYFMLWITLLSILLVMSITDMKARIIPNGLVLFGAGLGLMEHSVMQGWHGCLLSAISGVAWFVLGVFLWRTSSIGGGDMKMLAMIAMYTGALGTLFILMIAVVGQFLMVLIRFARGKMELRLPFAPAVTLGSMGLLLLQIPFR